MASRSSRFEGESLLKFYNPFTHDEDPKRERAKKMKGGRAKAARSKGGRKRVAEGESC